MQNISLNYGGTQIKVFFKTIKLTQKNPEWFFYWDKGCYVNMGGANRKAPTLQP